MHIVQVGHDTPLKMEWLASAWFALGAIAQLAPSQCSTSVLSELDDDELPTASADRAPARHGDQRRIAGSRGSGARNDRPTGAVPVLRQRLRSRAGCWLADGVAVRAARTRHADEQRVGSHCGPGDDLPARGVPAL